MVASKITHDYYAVLGITQTGDEAVIRASYKRLAKLRHPDKNLANPNATAEFQLVCSRTSSPYSPYNADICALARS
ncbi:uncharacterized protein B0H64DRAFT_379261 [Chaetomium fimeti]|uniref:J domain-containing protein n=1 Tax=Chaetomium fimeti TaxID=1854472 RepID=A0AAE0HP62_9PEZI|nr:hypothetical protein B0H64DRAFT_379261 [Chaetomium fimeti]